MKVKEKAQEAKVSTTRVFSNALHLLEATALAIVAGFSLYQAYTNPDLNALFAKVLLVSGVAIAIEAAHQFINHLNK